MARASLPRALLWKTVAAAVARFTSLLVRLEPYRNTLRTITFALESGSLSTYLTDAQVSDNKPNRRIERQNVRHGFFRQGGCGSASVAAAKTSLIRYITTGLKYTGKSASIRSTVNFTVGCPQRGQPVIYIYTHAQDSFLYIFFLLTIHASFFGGTSSSVLTNESLPLSRGAEKWLTYIVIRPSQFTSYTAYPTMTFIPSLIRAFITCSKKELS